MSSKNNKSLEERLLTPMEIDEKISELKKQKLGMLVKNIGKTETKCISDFDKVASGDVFDYSTFYEVSDIKNNTVYYLNGPQIAALFGLNDEYKKQFMQKKTNGQAQLDDKLISFYCREYV
ncbi:MAG: hypothetical protein PHX18_00155 [Candidatus Gastranaerophilales bacterium]|nr:hypothetical protein [Candidatus Gastranaerophilales bacterium]